MDIVTGSRFLGVLAIAAFGAAVVAPLLRRTALAPLVRDAALPLAGLIAVVATAGSLWYSEGIGLEPCTLCWYQRAAMYPLALLVPLLAARRSTLGVWAARGLAGVGLAISLWHVALQRVPALSGTTACSSETPCSAALVEVFGVLTIPTMAAAGFAAVLVLTSLVDAKATA